METTGQMGRGVCTEFQPIENIPAVRYATPLAIDN